MSTELDSSILRRLDRHRAWVLTVMLIGLAATALVLLARPAAETGRIDPPANGGSGFGPTRESSPDEVRAYLNDMFDRLDRDGSGSVEVAEAPVRQLISATLRDGTIRQLPMTRAEWLERGDENGDGRVTRTEFFVRLVPPVQSILGVPETWRPVDVAPPPEADKR